MVEQLRAPLVGTIQGRVGQVLRAWAPFLGRESLGLVRSLDSQGDVQALHRLVRAHCPSATRRAEGVLVEVGELAAAADNLFDGFDEVWFFSGPAIPGWFRVAMPPLTSDAFNLNVECPLDLARLFTEPGLLAALGDGCGLNFAVRDMVLLKSLLAISAESAAARGGPCVSPGTGNDLVKDVWSGSPVMLRRNEGLGWALELASAGARRLFWDPMECEFGIGESTSSCEVVPVDYYEFPTHALHAWSRGT